MSPDSAPKILVIRRDNIGDLVCTTPLIAALRDSGVKDITIALKAGSPTAKKAEGEKFKVATVENIAQHARIVRSKATARRLILEASGIVDKGYEAVEVEEYIDHAQQVVFEIANRSNRQSYEPVRKVLHNAIKAIEHRFNRKEAITGVPSDFHKFDGMTAGFQPGDLIIIAARPSMGKTSYVMNCAQNAALDHGVPVLVFSLEMSKESLIERVLCSEARVDSQRLRGGFLERIFGAVLGYATMANARDGQWELVAEKTMHSGGSADGAIGFFARGKSHVVAPIELKGATQFLEHAKGRALTPIQQGWDYANKAPESRWVIVSNYRETRLYAGSRGQGAYELAHEVLLTGWDTLRGWLSREGAEQATITALTQQLEEGRRREAQSLKELLDVEKDLGPALPARRLPTAQAEELLAAAPLRVLPLPVDRERERVHLQEEAPRLHCDGRFGDLGRQPAAGAGGPKQGEAEKYLHGD